MLLDIVYCKDNQLYVIAYKIGVLF